MACEAPLNYTSDNSDCDDNDAASYPGAAEICDGKDNNCDGQIDEGVQSLITMMPMVMVMAMPPIPLWHVKHH